MKVLQRDRVKTDVLMRSLSFCYFGKKEKLCVIQLFREKRIGGNRWISPWNKEVMNNVLRFLDVFVC